MLIDNNRRLPALQRMEEINRGLVRALRFYSDPWAYRTDPEDRIPDFYSELDFGNRATEALAAAGATKAEPANVNSGIHADRSSSSQRASPDAAFSSAVLESSEPAAVLAEREIRDWIEREFVGHGVAVRHIDDPPIPGEPLMSMAVAKYIVRRAFVRAARTTPTKTEEAITQTREQIEQETVAKVVAWLHTETNHPSAKEHWPVETIVQHVADAIERGDWKVYLPKGGDTKAPAPTEAEIDAAHKFVNHFPISKDYVGQMLRAAYAVRTAPAAGEAEPKLLVCNYPSCNCAVSFPAGYKPSVETECPRTAPTPDLLGALEAAEKALIEAKGVIVNYISERYLGKASAALHIVDSALAVLAQARAGSALPKKATAEMAAETTRADAGKWVLVPKALVQSGASVRNRIEGVLLSARGYTGTDIARVLLALEASPPAPVPAAEPSDLPTTATPKMIEAAKAAWIAASSPLPKTWIEDLLNAALEGEK